MILLLILPLVAACKAQPTAIATVVVPSITASAVIPSPTQLSSPTVSPTPLPTLTLEKGPYLLVTGNPSEMRVCWQPVSPAPAVLQWGLDQNYGLGSIAVAAAGQTDLSSAVISGLQASTRYYYRILINGAAATGNFVSLKAAEDPDLTFWVYGDSESGQATHNAIDAAILKSITTVATEQTLLFSAGDLMESASEENLQKNEFSPDYPASRQILSELPVINVMGNHDGTKLFLKYFPYPYTGSFDWSFDDGPVHFVVIDQYYGGDESAPRWQWLRNDLATTTKKWKVLLMHEPGWSAGPHPDNEDVQKIIHPIAVRYGVALVLAGHNHYYARAEVDGVTYLTTGGAGTLLYDPENGFPYILKKVKEHHYLKVSVQGDEMNVSALTSDGNLIDQIQIKR